MESKLEREKEREREGERGGGGGGREGGDFKLVSMGGSVKLGSTS